MIGPDVPMLNEPVLTGGIVGHVGGRDLGNCASRSSACRAEPEKFTLPYDDENGPDTFDTETPSICNVEAKTPFGPGDVPTDFALRLRNHDLADRRRRHGECAARWSWSCWPNRSP